MKKKMKKVALLMATVMLSCLTVTSCGLRNNPESTESVSGGIPANAEEDSTTAVARFHYVKTSDYLQNLQAYAINSEWLYTMESLSPMFGAEDADLYTHVNRIRISDGYEEQDYIVNDIKTTEARSLAFFVDKEGNCYLFWRTYFEAEEAYALEKYGTDGELLWHTAYKPEELLNIGERLSQGTVTEDGRLFLYSYGTEGKIFAFSQDGSLSDVYDSELRELEGVAVGTNGKVYEYCVTGGNPQFRELGGEESYVCPMTPLSVYNGYREGICLRTGDGMWSYVPEKGEVKFLWGWEDEYVQINGDCVDRFFCGDGEFTMLCDETLIAGPHTKPVSTFASITLEDRKEYPARQTVTLSGFFYDMSSQNGKCLEQMVKFYNRQAQKYKVEILEDRLDEDLLRKQLIQGQGPDLIDISGFYAEDLAALGAFEDLTPYYEASKVVDREDILDSVRTACIMGGREVGVMPSFELRTLLAKEAYCTPEDWTVWKFLEMSQNNRMFGEQTSLGILSDCMGIRYGEYFVDTENKKSYFDGEEFRRILKECNTAVHYAYEQDRDGAQKFKDREELFCDISICSLWDMVSDEDEDYSSKMLGYPGWNGGEYKLIGSGIFAINSSSGNKEGAWDFLEFLLSEEFQCRVSWAFPVIRSYYETCLTDLYITPSRLNASWYLGDPAIPTEKDVARLKEMVDSSLRSSFGGWANPIANVVIEEATMYFAGDATLDATVNKIQNRMQTYLNE